MRYGRRLSFVLVPLLAVLVISACSGSDKSSSGVAQIEEAPAVEPSIQSAGLSNLPTDTPVPVTPEPEVAELSDEEIATNFTACLRDAGFDVPDPTLNADGTVDLLGLRQSIGQNQDILSSGALIGCLPLLAEASFAQEPSQEDEVELQDNILKMAQCLRDDGIDVPDPDFSNGIRAAMGGMIQGLSGADSRLAESVEKCGQQVFGGNVGRR
mgnify:CR=1 FL=1|jgi:hypothetical protein